MARQRHQAKMAAVEGGKETGGQESKMAALKQPQEAAQRDEESKMAEKQPQEVQKDTKMAAVERERENGGEEGCVFLAFSRVFSGVLRRGQTLYVLQPQYDPREAILEEGIPPHTSTFIVGDLYVLMGRSLVPVDHVPAGNVVGIAGLEESVIKSATLSSTLACPAFGAMNVVATPIVRVAVEPFLATDLRPLVQGLKLLNQADLSVEVSVQETGEHILAAAGEVHLQKCLDDLEKQYARVRLKVSAPIIPFRETVVPRPTVDMVNEEISGDNEVKVTREQR